MTETLQYMMVEATADGSSRFVPAVFDLHPGEAPNGAPAYAVTANLEPQRMVFTEFPAGFEMDWHTAPRRQFIIMISGTMEVTTGDGDTRFFRPGDILLVSDLDGIGHRTAAGNDKKCSFASVAAGLPGAEHSPGFASQSGDKGES